MPDWNGLGYMQLAGQLSSDRANRRAKRWSDIVTMFNDYYKQKDTQQYELTKRMPLEHEQRMEEQSSLARLTQLLGNESPLVQAQVAETEARTRGYPSAEESRAVRAQDLATLKAQAEEAQANRDKAQRDLENMPTPEFAQKAREADRRASEAQSSYYDALAGGVMPWQEEAKLQREQIAAGQNKAAASKEPAGFLKYIYLSADALKGPFINPATDQWIGFESIPRDQDYQAKVTRLRGQFIFEMNQDPNITPALRDAYLRQFDAAAQLKQPTEVEQVVQEVKAAVKPDPRPEIQKAWEAFAQSMRNFWATVGIGMGRQAFVRSMTALWGQWTPNNVPGTPANPTSGALTQSRSGYR